MADKKARYSKIKSAGLGAVQGFSLGFADELEGGIKSLVDVAGDDKNLSDLLDLYKARRDESRGMYKEAQEENPKSYLGGTLAGALGTAFIPGASALGAAGGMQAARIGAATGALSGIGASDADNLGDMAEDAAFGGVVGGIAGPLANQGFSKIKGLVGKKPAPISAEAARQMQKEMQQAMEAIGEGTARLPQKPSVFAKTPEQLKEIMDKIQEVEANLPELIKHAQKRKNLEIYQRAQQQRIDNPDEVTAKIAEELNKKVGNGQ